LILPRLSLLRDWQQPKRDWECLKQKERRGLRIAPRQRAKAELPRFRAESKVPGQRPLSKSSPIRFRVSSIANSLSEVIKGIDTQLFISETPATGNIFSIGCTSETTMPEDDLAIEWTRIIAERKINEAIDLGVFDNLPGKGKPLRLDDDSLTPPHLRAAHRLLRNAGVAPEWVLLEREIASTKAEAEAIFSRAIERFLAGNTTGLASLRDQYRLAMKEANNLILKHNMAMPNNLRCPIPFRIKSRLTEWDERFELEKQQG
jgi:hypothetical protein